jgi:hypothetical protein
VSSEQRIRAILFYLSVSIFFIGLPLILSFALGYKFNTKTFKFTKAGLISLKTQPQGASIYLDGKLLSDKTPTTINELLPGKYRLRIELENHYAWFGEINVEPRKVTRLEKIILFPLRPNVSQLNKERITSFWLDRDREKVYYIDHDENAVYMSDLDGGHFEEMGILPESLNVKEWKISPDKEKLLCFNPHQVAVINLKLKSGPKDAGSPIFFDYSNRRIIEVFWHSDSFHLVLVTDRNIEVLEMSSGAMPVNLLNLNKRTVTTFYDNNRDTLYFIDSERAADAKTYDNVYKLELGTKFSPFKDLMKTRSGELN